MKYIKFLMAFIIAVILTACGSGANITPTNYGQLQSQSRIGSDPITVNYLQSQVKPLGACFGINLNLKVIDNSYFQSPHTGADLCDSNYDYIQESSNAILFGDKMQLDSFVKDNTSGVTGVNQYKITYNTPSQPYYYAGGASSNETVSGLVIVPQGIAPDKIKGVVLYYHATVFSKGGVPSDYTDLAGQYTEWLLSSVYASQGYIVVAPDYLGQGENSGSMHPYVLYAQSNAISGINMLNATSQLLNQLGVRSENSKPLNLYISSYSEGGPYAVWASRLLSSQYAGVLTNNNMVLKRTVAISGAYNLSYAMIPYAYDNSNNSVNPSVNTYNVSPGMLPDSIYALNSGSFASFSGVQQVLANFSMATSKSALGSYAFASFINYNFTPAAYPILFRSQNFINMTSCTNLASYIMSLIIPTTVTTGACPISASLQNIFTNPSYKQTDIATTIYSSAMANNQYFTGGESGGATMAKIVAGGTSNNSIIAFAEPVLSDPILMSTIRQADTWSFNTNTPISFLYLDYDSTVTNLNSKDACSPLGVAGLSPSGSVSCLNVDNTKLYTAQEFSLSAISGQLALMEDHAQAEFILNLVALNQIKNNQ